CMQCRHIPPTF
nr:immunoglobulin light chain junction region [Macaca mulatta]